MLPQKTILSLTEQKLTYLSSLLQLQQRSAITYMYCA